MPRPPHKIRPSAYAAANLKRMGRILQGSLQPLKPNQHFGKAIASGAILMSSAGSESPNSMEALFYERSCVWVGWFEKRSQVDSVGVGCPSWTYKWLFGWNKKSMWTKQKFYKWHNVVGAHRRAVLQMLCVSTTTALAWSNDHCQWIFTAVKPPCSPDLTIWLCLKQRHWELSKWSSKITWSEVTSICFAKGSLDSQLLVDMRSLQPLAAPYGHTSVRSSSVGSQFSATCQVFSSPQSRLGVLVEVVLMNTDAVTLILSISIDKARQTRLCKSLWLYLPRLADNGSTNGTCQAPFC